MDAKNIKKVKVGLTDIVEIVYGNNVVWKHKLENIALGKVISASSISSSYRPAYLIDGIKKDDTKRWISTSSDSNPQIVFNLGSKYKISEIRIYSGAQKGTSGYITSVSITANGSLIVNDKSVNKYETIYILKQSCKTDKLYFNFAKGFNRIYEIEIYGEAI